jgi:hypothetical protein
MQEVLTAKTPRSPRKDKEKNSLAILASWRFNLFLIVCASILIAGCDRDDQAIRVYDIPKAAEPQQQTPAMDNGGRRRRGNSLERPARLDEQN